MSKGQRHLNRASVILQSDIIEKVLFPSARRWVNDTKRKERSDLDVLENKFRTCRLSFRFLLFRAVLPERNHRVRSSRDDRFVISAHREGPDLSSFNHTGQCAPKRPTVHAPYPRVRQE